MTVTAALGLDQAHFDIDVDDLDRRLKKAGGQIDGIRRMVASGRRCVDILDQLAAARAALDAVAVLIVTDELRAHIPDAATANDLVDSVHRLGRR